MNIKTTESQSIIVIRLQLAITFIRDNLKSMCRRNYVGIIFAPYGVSTEKCSIDSNPDCPPAPAKTEKVKDVMK